MVMWRFILATTIIISFCIGIEFIVLPIAVSLSGFWPGIVATLLTAIFVLISGLLYLEATLTVPLGSNVFSISRHLIGDSGTWITSGIFCYIHYAFLISYFLLGIPILSEWTYLYFGVPLSPLWGSVVIGLLLGGSVYLGTTFTLHFNFVIFLLLIGTYVMTLFVGSEGISEQALSTNNWIYLFFGIPALFNTFYYQSIIPTIATFLNHNRFRIQLSIVLSVVISLLIIVLWLWIVIGSGSVTIMLEAFTSEEPAFNAYLKLRHIPVFGKMIPSLLFFAFISSLLAAGLILVDFFSDAFQQAHHKLRKVNRLSICLLVFFPPMILGFIRFVPFIKFIHATAGIGEFILSTIIPIWWVWSISKLLKKVSKPTLFKKKGFLVFFSILSFFLLYLISVQLIHQITW